MKRFPWLGGLVLAPLAGITDSVYRQLVKRFHADLLVTELVSAAGLVRDDAKTWGVARFAGVERPLAVQIFGNKVEDLAPAAELVAARLQPDMVELNCGCPVRKVTRSGSGSRLLEDRVKLETIVRAMRARLTVPFGVKFRSGWRDVNAEQVAMMCEAAGVDYLTLHPRTGKQMFRGEADWRLIARVKQRVAIPVIGNGGVVSAATARRMFAETGCDAVMVGRWAIGRPWALRAIRAGLRDEPWSLPPAARLALLCEHVRLSAAQKGDRRGTIEMRKLLPGYTYRMPGATKLRQELHRIDDPDEFVRVIEAYAAELGT